MSNTSEDIIADEEQEDDHFVGLSHPDDTNIQQHEDLIEREDQDQGQEEEEEFNNGDDDEDAQLVRFNHADTAAAQEDEHQPLFLEPTQKGGQQLKGGSEWKSKLSARQRSRRIRTASLLCFCVFSFALTVLLALGFAISAFVSHYYIDWLINEGVRDRIILDPEINGDYFRRWETNTCNDSAPRYEFITMFNLTNAQDVVNRGAVPEYQEVGPYVYRKFIHRFNLTWTRDRDVIFFKQRDWYVFDRNMSNSTVSPTDIIYNINPSYTGAMMSLGSESMLMRNMASESVVQILTFLTTGFLSDIESAWRPVVLDAQVDVCITSTSLQEFYSNWSDAFVPPNEDYEGMLLSEGLTTPTNISTSSTTKLFSTVNQPYSLVNTSAYIVWDNACKNSNISAAELLKSVFQITDFQLKRICNWLPVFQKQWVLPFLNSWYGISSLSDLGWLQWGTGQGMPLPYSAKDRDPTLPGFPEYYFFLKNVYQPTNLSLLKIDIMAAKVLLRDGRNPMFDSRNMANFFSLLDRNDYLTILASWPELESIDRARAFGEYSRYLIRTFVNATLQQSFAKNIGLVSRRSVTEWMFSYDDPFLKLLNPPLNIHPTLMGNDTSLDAASARQGRNAMITGRYNTSLVSELVLYNGTTDLHCWKEPTQVQGTLGENFSPRLGVNDSIELWFPQLFRELVFWPETTVDLEEITVRRYRLAPFVSLPNDLYFSQWFSIANISITGAPLFVSRPHFYGSEDYWATRLRGIKDPDPMEDNTFLEVEPITGITLNEGKRVQVNIYLPNDTLWFDVYHRSTPTGMLYPLAAIDERSTLTAEEAMEFHDTVYTAMFLGWWSIVGGLAAAVACLALALVALISIVGIVIQMFGASW